MSDDEQWIEVCRWEEFQHPDTARSVVPVWIKNHVRLLQDDAYLSLTAPQRAVLHGLWMMYAQSRRKLPLCTLKLSRMLALRVSYAQLERLNHAGFIRFVASTDLEEKRKEKTYTTNRDLEAALGEPQLDHSSESQRPPKMAKESTAKTWQPDGWSPVGALLPPEFALRSAAPDAEEATVSTDTPEPQPTPEPEPDDDGDENEDPGLP